MVDNSNNGKKKRQETQESIFNNEEIFLSRTLENQRSHIITLINTIGQYSRAPITKIKFEKLYTEYQGGISSAQNEFINGLIALLGEVKQANRNEPENAGEPDLNGINWN